MKIKNTVKYVVRYTSKVGIFGEVQPGIMSGRSSFDANESIEDVDIIEMLLEDSLKSDLAKQLKEDNRTMIDFKIVKMKKLPTVTPMTPLFNEILEQRKELGAGHPELIEEMQSIDKLIEVAKNISEGTLESVPAWAMTEAMEMMEKSFKRLNNLK